MPASCRLPSLHKRRKSIAMHSVIAAHHYRITFFVVGVKYHRGYDQLFTAFANSVCRSVVTVELFVLANLYASRVFEHNQAL